MPTSHEPEAHMTERFVLVVTSLLLAGTCVADNCDSRCRNRTQFYKCPGVVPGEYRVYALPDCWYCTRGGTCDTAAAGSDRDCIRSGQNAYQTRTSGLRNCDCGVFVEAALLADYDPDSSSELEFKYVCDTTVIVPPPGG